MAGIRIESVADSTHVVAEYQRIIGERDTATDAFGRAEFDSIAHRLRAAWKTWQSEDSLHEMAFGEPVD